MSKSIYEETFNHLDELVDVLAHIEGSFLYRHYLDNIRLKLKKAQKQEKLLELYKRLNKVQTLLSWYKIHTINLDKIEKHEREVFDITKRIKELENE